MKCSSKESQSLPVRAQTPPSFLPSLFTVVADHLLLVLHDTSILGYSKYFILANPQYQA